MKSGARATLELREEAAELRARVAELEATIEAIHTGAVDAIVVDGPEGIKLFTLQLPDEPYRILAEGMNEGVATLTSQGTVLFCNRRLADMVGLPSERLLGSSLVPLVACSGQQDFLELVRLALAINMRFEATLKRDDSTTVPVQLSLSQIPLGGAGQGVCLLAVDMTERKRMEEELAQRARDLSRSNDELEQFAYIASHDLQEPLHMVASYTHLLASRYREHLDETAIKYIDYAVEGAHRMQALINDLLALSRVTTRGKPFAPVNLNQVVTEVRSMLAAAIQEKRACIESENLPTVLADSTQMHQLLQNLIGNAMKFNGDQAPIVHICTSRRDGEWMISVEDNGIGIDPQFADRIFVAFQRLHTREEYPGNGIGLAICKKIVERHGGRIWVDSRAGAGAKFTFTIPACEVRERDTEVRIGGRRLEQLTCSSS